MNGKVVIITGAAGGIGRALAGAMLEAGATVWGWDLSLEGLETLKRQGEKLGQEIRTRQVDVTDPKAMEAAAAEVFAREKRIDYWVNNAGIVGIGSFAQLPANEFDRVIQINFSALVTGTRLALGYMEDQGSGTIVNIASVAGHVPAPFLIAYTASKHAVVGFTRSLREELRLRDSNIRCTLVSPGFVDTALIARKSKAMGFPEWLSWALASPDAVAREIVIGLRKGHEEIFPALNGRVILRMYRLLPQFTVRRSRIFLADSFKDFLLNRYRVE
jgi:short-subunit dehydrogenase